ncbi:bromodomain-containing protein 7 [Rhagoletis pomonella]|uniref:bromodomain-containing protein 7 n=1 Tax=Rhagoletis pomonella TaxID=28610 RepID=UPI00177BE8C6|nr:bromodomain-containing protein 7 [Rhagoletis pomonella]
MGSSKKHKKHKSERREKYEEYSNNMDPSQLQRGLKLILKVGSNSTPEYSGGSPLAGPPTAAEAMMSAAPSSPVADDLPPAEEYYGEKHKKSKKKKKKKDREKKHKHHKEKRHRSERHEQTSGGERRDASVEVPNEDIKLEDIPPATISTVQRSPRNVAPPPVIDGDSSQDGFSFMEDGDSQPLPENILLYAGITTDNSPSCRPVSKPIVPRKTEDMLLDSPASSSLQSSSLGVGALGVSSPTKPLPDLLIPSPSASTAASTPGGTSSLAALTPKQLEAPKTPSSSSESGREPRTCVLKLKQQKSPLNKLLDHLLRFLEKRDPHQFFAWPVTDDIAPGYSSIITKPMDFSTIRQKIDDSEYGTLTEFTDDFKLMCENAIRYNHVDTVYHKAAKRLLQVGSKHLLPENLLRSLKPLSGYLRDLTAKELGFDLHGDFGNYDHHGTIDSADEGASTGAEEQTPAQLEEEEKRRAIRLENEPKTRFEPYVDDLTSEEILAQVQGAARAAKKRLSAKEKAHKMGFLRQNKDGTTSLNVLLKEENEGPEKVVSLGELVGKLESGSGQLYYSCEDKRNEAKMVKPLNYGAFASFAPSFDSRFSNLSREETQLVMRTYGDATSTEYAESILEFTKDSNYASMLANGLLDILTNGEHSKAMSDLYDMQVQNHEQHEVFKCFSASGGFGCLQTVTPTASETREQIEEEYEKYKNTRIDFNRLRTLKDLGIDIEFLDNIEAEMKNFELTRRLQEHLSNNLNLIEKLRATQHERLSQPLPQHLAFVPQASAEELHLAHQISQQLGDVAKKLPPSAVVDPYSLRKAMGMSNVGLPPPPPPTTQRVPLPEVLQQPVSLPPLQLGSQNSTLNISDENTAAAALPMEIDDEELREILESGNSDMHASTNADENPWL